MSSASLVNPIVREVLTPREADVAEQLLQGLSNRQIAERLGMTPRTVKAHLRMMFLRFQLGEDGRSGKRIRLARQLLGRA